MSLIQRFWSDECGFIVSAELVLVGTIGILGTIVGLSEISVGLVSELNDVSNAVGSLNQSFGYTGFSSAASQKIKGATSGSGYIDAVDVCDTNASSDIVAGAVYSQYGESVSN